jgi:hypothetical protein
MVRGGGLYISQDAFTLRKVEPIDVMREKKFSHKYLLSSGLERYFLGLYIGYERRSRYCIMVLRRMRLFPPRAARWICSGERRPSISE